MNEQTELFPVGDYTDRPDYTDIYYLPTSTRRKHRLIKRALSGKDEAPQTSNVNTIQGT